jgi:hypothetical protein
MVSTRPGADYVTPGNNLFHLNLLRVKDKDPKRRSMQDLQVSQNEVARVLTKCKRSDRVTVHHLLEKAGMTSVNRIAAGTILIEMWRTMGGNSVDKESLATIKSTSLW